MYYAWSSCLSLPVHQPNDKPSALCMIISDHQLSSNNSNSHQHQPLATDKQANRYQEWVCQQEWKPLIYKWQSLHANTMPTVLCTSNGLICGYIAVFTSACKQKKNYVICHMKFVAVHWNFTNTISYTLTITHTTDNSQLTLYRIDFSGSDG